MNSGLSLFSRKRLLPSSLTAQLQASQSYLVANVSVSFPGGFFWRHLSKGSTIESISLGISRVTATVSGGRVLMKQSLGFWRLRFSWKQTLPLGKARPVSLPIFFLMEIKVFVFMEDDAAEDAHAFISTAACSTVILFCHKGQRTFAACSSHPPMKEYIISCLC